MLDYIKIGRTLKAHGIKGELKIDVEDIFWDNFVDLDALFLDIKGQKVPFFIEAIRGEGTPILKLEDMIDRSMAEGFQHKDIYVRRQDIGLTDKEIAYGQGGHFHHLKGYTLVDTELGDVGIIEAIEEYPQQEMAVLKYKEKTIIVPLVEAFVVREDTATKRLYMSLPEGFLDL